MFMWKTEHIRFPKGKYRHSPTLLDMLNNVELKCNKNTIFNNFLSTIDIESTLEITVEQTDNAELTYLYSFT